MNKMDNKATSWIHAAIKALAATGKIEVNEVCRIRGKSKSSFYNVYPNMDGSRGKERFVDDVIEHHDHVMQEYDKMSRRLLIIYENYSDAVEEAINLLGEFFDYHKCSAQIRIRAITNKKFKDYWEVLQAGYAKRYDNFKKVYDMNRDSDLDRHGLVLVFDLILYSKDKDDFVQNTKDLAHKMVGKMKGY